MKKNPDTVAIIVAAGTGRRARSGGDATPKQYVAVARVPVLAHTIRAFTDCVDHIIVVTAPDQAALFDDLHRDHLPGVALTRVDGGATRQASVLAGLEAAKKKSATRVLIHDGARPLVSPDLIRAVEKKISPGRAVLPAVPVAETLKTAREDQVTGTLDRDGTFLAQTPQGFMLDDILALHRQTDATVTDDVALFEAAGLPVDLVPGRRDNLKITTPEDFAMAERLLATPTEPRIGFGFDVHAFDAGDEVILCGIHIPHTHKLKGHSDADVALHAVTDALLGALAIGDIGTFFPPSDPRWKGAPSSHFIRYAMQRLRHAGGRVGNVDLTIICEAPKIAPWRDPMAAQLADYLDITPDRCSVKATTTEKLGFTGRREGIAAQAAVTLYLPVSPLPQNTAPSLPEEVTLDD